MAKSRPVELIAPGLWAAPAVPPEEEVSTEPREERPRRVHVEKQDLHLVLLEGTTEEELVADLHDRAAKQMGSLGAALLRARKAVFDPRIAAALLLFAGLLLVSAAGLFLERFFATFDLARPIDVVLVVWFVAYCVVMLFLFHQVPSITRGETDGVLPWLDRRFDPAWRSQVRFRKRLEPLVKPPESFDGWNIDIWLFDDALLEQRWFGEGLLPALARTRGSVQRIRVIVAEAARAPTEQLLGKAGLKSPNLLCIPKLEEETTAKKHLSLDEKWLLQAVDGTASDKRLGELLTGKEGRVVCDELVQPFLEILERDGAPSARQRGGRGYEAVLNRLERDLRVLGREKDTDGQEWKVLRLDDLGDLLPEEADRIEAANRRYQQSNELLLRVSQPLAALLLLEKRIEPAIDDLCAHGRLAPAFVAALENFVDICEESYDYTTFQAGWRHLVKRFDEAPLEAGLDLGREVQVPLLFRLLRARALGQVATLLKLANQKESAKHALHCLEALQPARFGDRLYVCPEDDRERLRNELVEAFKRPEPERSPLAHLRLSVDLAWEVAQSEREELGEECCKALETAERLIRAGVAESDPRLVHKYHNAQGHWHTWRKSWKQARDSYRQALLVPIVGRLRQSSIFVNMGITYRRWGQATSEVEKMLERMEWAAELNRAGVQTKRKAGQLSELVFAAHNLVETWLRYGCRLPKASDKNDYYRKARELAAEAIEKVDSGGGDHPRLDHLLFERHLACRALGDHDAADGDHRRRLLDWLPKDDREAERVTDNRKQLLDLWTEVTGEPVEGFIAVRALVEALPGNLGAVAGGD